jgi:hypothetical protein
MKGKSGSGHPFPYRFQRFPGFFTTPAQDDHVVRIPRHLEAETGHEPVQRIEIYRRAS